MNKLPLEKRIQILNMMVEGASMRAISRVVDVSFNTVAKLLADAGLACVASTRAFASLPRWLPASRIGCGT